MKILVFSDSHGELRCMEEACMLHRPDLCIHLGDRLPDARKMQECFPDLPFFALPGNCDFSMAVQPVQTMLLGGIRFYMTHGHLHGVKTGLTNLTYAAMEAEAQVALFGHTHRAVCEERAGIHLLNPGACGGAAPSYGIVEIENGTAECRVMYCD